MEPNQQGNLPDKTPEQIVRSKRAKRSKQKGHQAERDLCTPFRDAGYDKVCTTRSSSRMLDACGIDLNFIPVIIQSKAGAQSSLNVAQELKYIRDRVAEKLPADEPWHDRVKIIVHSVSPGRGTPKSEHHTIASLTFEDLMKLIVRAYPPPKPLL